jgi:hypothetical protein
MGQSDMGAVIACLDDTSRDQPAGIFFPQWFREKLVDKLRMKKYIRIFSKTNFICTYTYPSAYGVGRLMLQLSFWM